jgi:SAM-dependent methyltransferase
MQTTVLSETDRGQHLSRKLPAPLRRLARRYSDWNYGWQADIALRYVPVEDALRARPPKSRKTSQVCDEVVLDVGCGSKGGVTSYLPLRTLGVDLAFNVGRIRRHPAVTPVVGSGMALPLGDASVAIALCMDTLEHLPGPERAMLVAELFRVVADDGVVIAGAPCGLEARQTEQTINAHYRQRTGRDHPWLSEHLENEPLTPQSLSELMVSAASRRFQRFDLELVPNTNLALWQRLQEQGLLRHVHRLVFQPLWPLIRNRHELPAYRQVCVVAVR